MSCMICNPICGKCKPPERRMVVCPECEKLSLFEKHDIFDGEKKLCPRCGTEVTELLRIEPITCKYSGLICAYPCGRSTDDSRGVFLPCMSNTPMSRYDKENQIKVEKREMINKDLKTTLHTHHVDYK